MTFQSTSRRHGLAITFCLILKRVSDMWLTCRDQNHQVSIHNCNRGKQKQGVLYRTMSNALFRKEIYTHAVPSFVILSNEIVKNKTLTIAKVVKIGVIMEPHYSASLPPPPQLFTLWTLPFYTMAFPSLYFFSPNFFCILRSERSFGVQLNRNLINSMSNLTPI